MAVVETIIETKNYAIRQNEIEEHSLITLGAVFLAGQEPDIKNSISIGRAAFFTTRLYENLKKLTSDKREIEYYNAIIEYVDSWRLI